MKLSVNLPNMISLARLFSVPLIVSLILSLELKLAFLFFTLAGLSDALDGLVARLFKSRTILGAYLDPIADKALLVGVYASLGLTGLVEQWVVILIVFRDLLIVGGIFLLFLFKSHVEMKPLMISKINTVIQLFYALFVLSQAESYFGVPELNLYFGYFVALTTVISGASYVTVGLRQLNKVDATSL